MDERPLLALDHVLLLGHVGHGEELLLGDERALFQALARDDHVGKTDEATGDEAQRRETQQGVDGAGRQQGRPLRMLHGPRLGRGLGEHEDHADLEGDADGDAPRTEVVAQQPDEGGHDHLAGEQQQEDGVEKALGVLDQAGEGDRPRPSLLLEGNGLDLVHPGQRRLGHGQEGGEPDEDDDDDDVDRVGLVHCE